MKSVLLFFTLLLGPIAFAKMTKDEKIATQYEDFSGEIALDDTSLFATDRQRVRKCGQFCSFRLCNFNGESFVLDKASFVLLDGPNTASLPYICKPGISIGQVRDSLQARVFFLGNFVPISSFSPRGLDTRYPKNFIKTSKIPFLPYSGIARKPTTGNQWDFLHDRCMIMPVSRYEEIDPDSLLPKRTVTVRGGNSDCVAFRTTAPAIQVELIWDSGDDFDVALTEPDGSTIEFSNPRSEAGKLNGDNNVGFCDSNLKFGRENIVYFPGGPIQNGTYRAKVTHYTKCGRKPTVFRLRVAINGVIVRTLRGTSGNGDQTVVARTSFMYP